MADRIAISGLEVFAFHGLRDEEKVGGQPFVIDVIAELDLSSAGSTDDLGATVDYGALAAAIQHRVATERWNLIERVATRVADLVLDQPGVESATVTVHKPQAPIRVPFSDVTVTITRRR